MPSEAQEPLFFSSLSWPNVQYKIHHVTFHLYLYIMSFSASWGYGQYFIYQRYWVLTELSKMNFPRKLMILVAILILIMVVLIYIALILRNFMCTWVVHLCPTLCHPMDSTHQALLSMGFSRQEYWSGLLFPSPGHLPWRRTRDQIFPTQGWNPGLLHYRQILYHLSHW